MEKKQKRFYKVDEMVWVVGVKREGKIKSINRETLEATVVIQDESLVSEVILKMWEIDKLKYKAKEQLVKGKKTENATDKMADILQLLHSIYYPEVFVAQVRESAIIPSKEDEDAGYDIYANLDNFKRETDEGTVYEIECPLLKTTLVPTGLAVALPITHYLNLKHERGSTAVQSMGVLAGVVDSGFRNEMFIALTPLYKSVIITSTVSKVVENETHILYPLSKAIAQGTVDLVPKTKLTTIALDKLQAIDSKRGMKMLGQSGK